MINTFAERQKRRETIRMTKEQIKRAIANVIAEREEIFDELDAIEAEEEPEIGTPQSHIDYLHERAEELIKEYYELYSELDALNAN